MTSRASFGQAADRQGILPFFVADRLGPHVAWAVIAWLGI